MFTDVYYFVKISACSRITSTCCCFCLCPMGHVKDLQFDYNGRYASRFNHSIDLLLVDG